MHVSSKIEMAKKTVQYSILHDYCSHNCLTSCLGWTNYHTIAYTCTQSIFVELLTFTTKTLILWWLHEMPTTTLTLTTCFKVKHTLSIFQNQSSCTLLASQFWVWYLLPGSTSGYPSLASWILALVLSTPWLFGAAIPFPFSVNNHQPHLITLKLGKKHLTGNGTLNKTTLAPSKQPNNSLGKHADTSAGCILKQPCDILYNGHSHNLVLHPIIRYDGSAKVGTNIGFLQIIQMILHMTLCMTRSTCGKS